MKYICEFYYRGFVFPAYVTADSFNEVFSKVENLPYNLLNIISAEGYRKNSFYPFEYAKLPETIKMNQLPYIFSGKIRLSKPSAKYRKQIKKLIKAGRIKGRCSIFQSKINFQSFLDYCSKKLQQRFAEMNINGYKEMPEEEEAEYFEQLQNDFCFDEINVEKPKEEVFIPSVFDIKETDLGVAAPNAFETPMSGLILFSEAYPLIEDFFQDFKSSRINLTFSVLIRAISKGLKGISVESGFKENGSSCFTYYTIDENNDFNKQEKGFFPFCLQRDELNLLLMFMGVPYGQNKGHWKGTRQIYDLDISFTTEVKMLRSGKRITITWDTQYGELKDKLLRNIKDGKKKKISYKDHRNSLHKVFDHICLICFFLFELHNKTALIKYEKLRLRKKIVDFFFLHFDNLILLRFACLFVFRPYERAYLLKQIIDCAYGRGAYKNQEPNSIMIEAIVESHNSRIKK